MDMRGVSFATNSLKRISKLTNLLANHIQLQLEKIMHRLPSLPLHRARVASLLGYLTIF
jgi:hypothetical protein